jgi:predicted  nucleic acid-binding Zn-ribbon protein
VSQPLPLKEQLKALENIQEIDHKIDNLRKNKGSLPAALKALDDQIAKVSASMQLKKSAISEVEKTQRQTSAALDLNKDRLARSMSRLESVQNSNEFQAAQKEIDQLKKQKESLDDQTKKSSSELEMLRQAMGEIEGSLGKFKEERDAQAATLTGQSGKMEEEIAALMQERAKHTPSVEPRLLTQYDRVRGARAGLGIAPAIAGRCKGCNMMVPPQQFNEIQRGSALHSCPSCHRILFAPTAAGGAAS